MNEMAGKWKCVEADIRLKEIAAPNAYGKYDVKPPFLHCEYHLEAIPDVMQILVKGLYPFILFKIMAYAPEAPYTTAKAYP